MVEIPQQGFMKRVLRKIESALQHNGFAFTFISLYFLINAVIMLSGAAEGRVLGYGKAFVQFDILARAGGAVLNFNSALIILVASKTLITYLRRTPLNMVLLFDKAMPAFHMIIGNMLVFGTILHVVFQACNYVMFKLWSNNAPDRVGLAHFRSLLLTGILLLVIIAVMCITSLSCVRKKKFEIFWASHTIGFVLYFFVLVLHGLHNKSMTTWRYILVPCVIYLFDRCVRFYREKDLRLVVSRGALQQKGDGMVCVRLPRTFTYLAGQYCELKLPCVSQFEWHPFTIASSPHESEILFFIKRTGDWTGKLYELAGRKASPTDDDSIVVLVRGPYGTPAQHVGQYEHVVLISGGVGATPFASITKYVHHWILNYTQRGMQTGTSVSDLFTRHQRTCRNDYDSTKALFDGDDEAEAAELEARCQRVSESAIGVDVSAPYREIDIEMGGIQLEDESFREQQTASNAYSMIDMDFGSEALSRHMQTNENALVRSSVMRASMNAMNEALERAPIAERLLFYLHSVTVHWILIWIMVLRAVASAGGSRNSDRSAASWTWLFFADEVGNVFDVFFLIPLLLSSVVLTFYFLFFPNNVRLVFEMTVFAIWPLTTLLLLWRTARTVWSRISLAQHFKSTHSQTKSLDFIWTSKTHTDDQWLISELLPLAGSGILRLHRFITREDATVEPWMLEYEKVPIKTCYNRPNWDNVFSSLIERTRSGSVVGVFFCGPKRMAYDVQRSAMKAMAASVDNALQRGYMTRRMHGVSSAMIIRNPDPDDAVHNTDYARASVPNSCFQDIAAYGCNVRISVRTENFS
eukprot:IDg31t1